MTADRDSRFPPDGPEEDFEDEEAPRSIFSAAWFRIVLVLLGIGVVGAVAVPYVLDVVNPRPGGGPKTASAPAPTPSAPSATPKPAEKAPAPVAEAPKPPAEKLPAAAPKPAPAGKLAVKKTEPAPAAREQVAAARPAPARANAAQGGDYFVQVGAFKDPEIAKRVAARLRDQSYPVDESVKRVGGAAAPAPAPRPAPRAAAPSGPDRYDVIVSGGAAAEINTKLAAKGLASEPAGDGVRIRPSLPLRDAVALSKDLGSEGFKVQVRRGGGASPEPAASAASTSDAGGGQTLYRVRVGGYPDRAAAQTVLKELQEKGFQPFIAKGRE
jgi:cell division septation protein DedD